MREFIQQALLHRNNIAIVSNGCSFTYSDLLDRSADFASHLINEEKDLHEQRVCFMVLPGFDYVTTQWAIWRAGGIAVPLCLSHPLPSLQYVIEDTGASMIIVSSAFEPVLKNWATEKGIRLIVIENKIGGKAQDLPTLLPARRAMILYTSGTTNLPKGVVITHHQLKAQITSLIHAWKWSEKDSIICVLPLHHVHGIVNVVGCSLYSGARCTFLPEFDAKTLFDVFLQGGINVFMAVPTIYFKLIAYFETLPSPEQQKLTTAMKKFRLMVSGSAALPATVMEKWKAISGQVLLERYGMTEIGMALSNPYDGERKAGHVGMPLPGVNVRLVDDQYKDVNTNEPGEILVKGENVFHEYWNKPEATREAFTQDGWFKTGDVAVLENGYYSILGRNSIDIIKSGGYKISALEIEEVLRTHQDVRDCAVIGLENEEWGELVAAAIVSQPAADTTAINKWLRERIPAYKAPKKYVIVNELPRNAMGKVTKNELKKLF